MITPVEVLGKELKRGFGYKAVEVDEFLEELAKDYEKVYKENNELREKVSALTENLSHYRYFTDKEWGNRKNYDLVLNSSVLGYDKCIELITAAYA